MYDIAIVGAGPAGCTAALTLQASGLRVALLDKAAFPRDKVCGDAIPGLAIKTLRRIAPAFAESFAQRPDHLHTRRTRFVWGEASDLEMRWVLPAYTAKRWDFDAALFDLVKKHTTTELLLGQKVKVLRQHRDYVELVRESDTLHASLVMGCDGAQSVVNQMVHARTNNRRHRGAAVRAYVQGVRDLHPDRTEIFLNRAFLPGYAWVFPLSGGTANIGFGMRSDAIARRRINLKTALYAFITDTPELKRRFDYVEWLSQPQGFGLPFGSQRVPVSTDRILLAGDAASLVDPLSGDGIGHAVLSGYLAAQVAMNTQGRTASDLKAYDRALWKALGADLQRKAMLQQVIMRFPWLLSVGTGVLRTPGLGRWVQRWVG